MMFISVSSKASKSRPQSQSRSLEILRSEPVPGLGNISEKNYDTYNIHRSTKPKNSLKSLVSTVVNSSLQSEGRNVKFLLTSLISPRC